MIVLWCLDNWKKDEGEIKYKNKVTETRLEKGENKIKIKIN